MKDFFLIQPGTPLYEDMIRLRIEELLLPVGVPASYIDREKEAGDLHIGASINGRLAGCCVLTSQSKELIQLRQMVVASRFRGSGIGAEIVAFAEKQAGTRGFKKLFLHARNPVIPFYEKSGYVSSGPEFFEVGIGHHRMEKEI